MITTSKYYCAKCKCYHINNGKSKVAIDHIRFTVISTIATTPTVVKPSVKKYWCKICKTTHLFSSKIGMEHLSIAEPTVQQNDEAEKLLKLQAKEDDWSHLSAKYPNIIGLTDDEISSWIANEMLMNNGEPDKIADYISHIKCYNPDDINDLSHKMYDNYKEWHEKSGGGGDLDSTVFITAPRGGYEILSDFLYANNIKEKYRVVNDFEVFTDSQGKKALTSYSLPYGDSQTPGGQIEIKDIVFVDDILMSGEQQHAVIQLLNDKFRQWNIDKSNIPRLHYMPIVAQNDCVSQKYKDIYKVSGMFDNRMLGSNYKDWTTVIPGQVINLNTQPGYNPSWSKYKMCGPGQVSSVVFPYSVPDGPEYKNALDLYKYNSKIRWKKR